jgi:hypothetical protein
MSGKAVRETLGFLAVIASLGRSRNLSASASVRQEEQEPATRAGCRNLCCGRRPTIALLWASHKDTKPTRSVHRGGR